MKFIKFLFTIPTLKHNNRVRCNELHFFVSFELIGCQCVPVLSIVFGHFIRFTTVCTFSIRTSSSPNVNPLTFHFADNKVLVRMVWHFGRKNTTSFPIQIYSTQNTHTQQLQRRQRRYALE